MRLKHEDYTENTDLVTELSDDLTRYTTFISDNELGFKHRLNLVRSVHLSRICIQFVFTDTTTKVLILGEDAPYWSDIKVKPDFGYCYTGVSRLLDETKQDVVKYLYEDVVSEV